MKSIKNRLCKIVVATAMILSGCFVTQTVEAVDDTGSSSYFDNENLVVSSNEIIGNNNIVFPTESHIPEDNEGSNKVGNEGEVWTAKKIDQIDDHGGYKITFYAQGFKYRNVDESNIKENNWKNPLAEGSTLTFAESLPIGDSNNQFTFSDLSVIRYVGLPAENAIVFEKDNSGNYTISFNANAVEIDEDKRGLAFDVEVSFLVNLNKNVNAGTYETNTAQCTFEPALDNYFYYKWGVEKTTETYEHGGLKWNDGQGQGEGFTQIQVFKNIDIPGNNGKENQLTFSLNSTGNDGGGTNPIKTTGNNISFQQFKISNSGYPTDAPKVTGTIVYEYYTEISKWLVNQKVIEGITNIDQFKEQYGIEKIYMYIQRENSNINFCIQVKYTDGIWKEFKPAHAIPSQGGNKVDSYKGTLYEYININKDKPEIRDENNISDGKFKELYDNYAKIELLQLSINNVETKKTASLINWDERTYQIDLYAKLNKNVIDDPINIVFALDFSGSMPWLIDKPVANNSDIKTVKLEDLPKSFNNANEVYVINENTSGTIERWMKFKYFIEIKEEGDSITTTEYVPIGYFDGDWYALKSKGGNDDNTGNIIKNESYKVTNETTIYYIENPNTKIKALIDQTQSFIDELAKSSPESCIGFTAYAGTSLSEDLQYGSEKLININTFLEEYQTVSNIVKNVKLTGNTAQGIGISEASEILENIVSDNKYIILFTDGVEKRLSNDNKTALSAAKEALNKKIKLYPIGLASESVLEKLEPQLKQWAFEGKYYTASNYNDLKNAFNKLFSGFVTSIKDVTVVDTIDERFYIPVDEVDRLQEQNIIVQGNKIIWNISELSYVKDILNGQKLSINIKAKEDFLGGNFIPTNVTTESYVYLNKNLNDKKNLDNPVVNVKTKTLSLTDKSETYYLGEEIDPIEFINKIIGQNFNITDQQKDQLRLGNQISVEYEYGSEANGSNSYGNYQITYTPVTDNEKVSDLKQHPVSKVGNDVEVYSLTIEYIPLDISTRQNEFSNTYSYTDISFTESHDSCDHTTEEILKTNPHIATKINASGKFSVNVVAGKIVLTKEIGEDDLDVNNSQGDPIFRFRITGTTVTGDKIDDIKAVRFTKYDNTNKLVAEIDNLEKGVYKITELDTIRFEFKSLSCTSDEDSYSKNGKSIVCYLGCDKQIGYDDNIETMTAKIKASSTIMDHVRVDVLYENEKINDNDQSDTDIVINTFEEDSQGNIIISGKHNNFED